MMFIKQDFDALPFPDIKKTPTKTKTTIRSLAQRPARRSQAREIMSASPTYGLDADAWCGSPRTRLSAASYRKAGKAGSIARLATCVPICANAARGIGLLMSARTRRRARAEFQVDTWREPWFFRAREADSVSVNPSLMRKAMDAANQRGCSRIIVHAPRKRGLLLGLLNQRRWWTVTRARLCAQHIIRERLGECGLAEHS
jgi:hypothetical protein